MATKLASLAAPAVSSSAESALGDLQRQQGRNAGRTVAAVRSHWKVDRLDRLGRPGRPLRRSLLDQASDAVQEAFLSAFRNLASFRGGSVRSWLTRITVNAAMDMQRAKRRRPVQPYPELEDDAWQPRAGDTHDPERIALKTERTRAITNALSDITADQRTAIVLFDVEGYDYAEIADMTGVSLGTVKSRIHRGRLAMRALLEGRMELFRS